MFNFEEITKAADAKVAEKKVVGTEALTKEVEREFCMWAKLSYGEMERLAQEGESHFYVDFLLKTKGSERRRVRVTLEGGDYTLKEMREDGSRVEQTIDMPLSHALAFSVDATLVHVVRRIRRDEPSIEGASWDIDLFVNNIGYSQDIFNDEESFKAFIGSISESGTYGYLAKIELEMKGSFEDGMTLSKLKEMSGVETDEYWSSSDKDPDVRNMLDNYWTYETNF